MRIGFIGLGVQGLPLAINLIQAGHDLVGFDTSAAPLDAIREAGGHAAGSVAEVAASSEVIFLCVATDAQVLDVVASEQGVCAHAARGTIVVNHGTVSAETTTRLLAATDAAGLRLADAPVSGGARGAQQRTMSFMVGGEDEVLDICEPLFDLSGPTILRTGPTGTATIGKLAHQVVVIGNILAMAEGMRLGVAAGLAPETIKRIIAGGFARSHVADTWGEIKMAPHAIPIYAKDLDNCMALAAELGIELPGARLMKQQLPHIVP